MSDFETMEKGWAKIAELTRQLAEVTAERDALKELATCACGDGFTTSDPGTCGNCLAATNAGLDALKADAERYRWLREPTNPVQKCYYSRGDFGKGLLTGKMLDAAIDAAREGK